MTEDYKQKMLDWLVGNYNTQVGDDIPEFIENNTKDTEILRQLQNKFQYGFYQTDYVLCKDNQNQLNGYVLVYGYYNYNEAHTIQKGYLMLLDNNFNLCEIITQYDSGTDFGLFQVLGVDEVGQIYGIDINNGTKRFIMLNNVSVKLPLSENYTVRLRQSYNLQGDIANATTFKFVRKSETSAKYLLVGQNNSYNPKVTQLTINVGAANDWTNYTYSGNQTDIIDLYAYWNSDDELNISIFYTTPPTRKDVKKLTISSETTLISTTLIENVTTYYYFDGNVTQLIVKSITENKFYFSLLGYYGSGLNRTPLIQTYLYNNTNIIQVYEFKDYEYTFNASQISIFGEMYQVNNTYFLQFYYNLNDSASIYSYIYRSMIALITETKSSVETSLGETTKYSLQTFNVLAINNQHNLYNVYYLNNDYEQGDVVDNVKLVYNINNYNGHPYQAINSMISNYANLYNSDNQLIFSKNLYDRLIQENITNSVVEISNTELNDINVQYQNLLSQTNNLMVTSENLFVKNIYEEVLLNFINTIIMQNQNDLNNIIDNNIGAARLNNSISNPNVLDYTDAKMTKYKINYTDTSETIGSLKWFKIRNFYRCKISIYNPQNNPITNIQLISEDENTVYQTIDCSNLETNKYFTISQDVYIDKKIYPTEVYYGSQQLYHNNNEIYY